MIRLIDADALPNELFKKHVHDGEELEPMLYFEDAVKVVENAPTIAAIPVEWLRRIADDDLIAPPYRFYAQAFINMWTQEKEWMIDG